MKAVEITSMWIPAMTGLDAVKKYEDLGVSRLVIPNQALKGKTPIEKIERFAEEVLGKA